MSRVLAWMSCVTVVTTVLLAGGQVAAPAAPATSTFVTMVGDPEEPVGAGDSLLWRDDEVTAVQGDSTRINVTVTGDEPGDHVVFTFAAPNGQVLTPGTYTEARYESFNDAPGLRIDRNDHYCFDQAGRFTVWDLAADLSRVWITYEHRCGDGVPATIGEIRWNQPGGDSDLLVAPGRVDWPEHYVGVRAPVVPVTVVNTGSDAVTISGASIASGQADFSVVSSSCATLAAGEQCTVDVAFAASRPGLRGGALRITDDTEAGQHVVPLTGRGRSAVTSLTMRSDIGDKIGLGRSYAFDAEHGGLSVSGDAQRLYLTTYGAAPTFQADFIAPEGRELQGGEVFGDAETRGVLTPGARPLMNVSGNSQGCSVVEGRFIVDHAVYDRGVMRELALRFEQRCDGSSAALSGVVRWNVDLAYVAGSGDAEAPPPPATEVRAAPGLGSANVSWTDPAGARWTESELIRRVGVVAPTSTLDGMFLAQGRKGSFRDTSIDSGKDYSYSVVTRDGPDFGDESVPTSVTLRGTAISLSVSDQDLVLGDPVVLKGVLREATSGAPVAGQVVKLAARGAGESQWDSVSQRTTASDGSFRVTLAPSRSTSFRAYFAGAGRRLGSSSDTRSTRVGARVSVSATPASGPRGTTFRLGARVVSDHRPDRLVLQRRVEGVWREVTRRVLELSDRTVFSVRPERRGEVRFRVVRLADSVHVRSVSAPVVIRVT